MHPFLRVVSNPTFPAPLGLFLTVLSINFKRQAIMKHNHPLSSLAVGLLMSFGLSNLACAQAVDVHGWSGEGNNAAPSVSVGETITATHSLVKSNYSDNPGLGYSAWAHAGGTPWYAFQLTETADVSIHLTPLVDGTNFAPAITVWATGNSIFDGGSDDIETGNNGWNAPHSFNATGQVGDFGLNWATGTNGNILETLVYAVTGPSHTDTSETGWGESIVSGVNDLSSNTFEQGISGTASGNQINLSFSSLSSGWYLAFIGGSNHALSSANYSLSVAATQVSSVPEPQTWALALTGLALMGAMVRRRA